MATDYENAVLRLWLTGIDGIGQKTQKTLLAHFKNIQDIYTASEKALLSAVDENKAKKIIQNKSLSKAKELYEKYRERNISIIYPGHECYPEKLLHIYDYPEILFVRGNTDYLKMQAVAIVGSRNPTVYGREIAAYMAGKLAKENLCIVSGLARGIDSQAHKGALREKGKTVAVLGCGINVTYPRENAELFANIEREGAVVSEYGFDVPPVAGLFPLRNRIISGISDGVLVVEAKEKSGSLITVDFGLEQGKSIYAIPGRVFDDCAKGTNNLIKQGALCVTDASDIIYDMLGREEACKEAEIKKLTDQEERIYLCLGLEPVFIDDIIAKTGLGITETISILYTLCEEGLIKQPAAGYYIRTIC